MAYRWPLSSFNRSYVSRSTWPASSPINHVSTRSPASAGSRIWTWQSARSILPSAADWSNWRLPGSLRCLLPSESVIHKGGIFLPNHHILHLPDETTGRKAYHSILRSGVLVVTFRRVSDWANSVTIENEANLSRHRQSDPTDAILTLKLKRD